MTRPRRLIVSVFGVWLALTASLLVAAQNAVPAGASTAAGTLNIIGDVARPLTLTPGELKTLPRRKVEVKTEAGATNVYEGVLAAEALKLAGVPLGAPMGRDVITSYVIASGSDGYQAVFGTAELDPTLSADDILIADTVDGQPLSSSQGPLRLVAPKDVRNARSVRMLQKLEVVRLRK